MPRHALPLLARVIGKPFFETYSPNATAFFWGTPQVGFLSENELLFAWQEIWAALPDRLVKVVKLWELSEVRTVIALVSFGEGIEAVWAMIFDPENRVIEEDFLLYGFPGIDQPPAFDGRISAGEYPHEVKSAGVKFSFGNGNVLLFGALWAPGTGWVSVGFDPELGMQGANYVITWVDQEGVHAEDHYGNGPTSHRKDRDSHVFRVAGVEESGVTSVEFIIPLHSGDPEDKPMARGKTYGILLAYHRNSDALIRHTARGKISITLE